MTRSAKLPRVRPPAVADINRNDFLRRFAYGADMPPLRQVLAIFAPEMPDRHRRRLGRWGSALALAAALGILLWLGLTGTGTRAEMRLAGQRAVRVAELRGSSVRERTRRLIGIAHPGHRDELTAKAGELGYV